MRVIGIIGKSRVGKDTAASYLAEQYGMVQFAVAEPVKDMLEPVFGDLFYAGDRKAVVPWIGHSPRTLMQTLGTDWGRKMLGEDIWLKVLEKNIAKTPHIDKMGVVVSDVRFRNEAQWVLDRGGILIHLVRDTELPKPPATAGHLIASLMQGREELQEPEPSADHVSENEDWDGIPRICLENNGDLNDLYTLLDEVMSQMNEEEA